jgi:hypothetical protein
MRITSLTKVSPTLLLLLLLQGTALVACGDDPAANEQAAGNNDDDDDDGASGSLDGGGKPRDSSLDAARPRPPDAGLSDAGRGSSDAGTARADASIDAGSQPSGSSALPPFETSGKPLDAADKAWTYIEFPDTSCRDGSKAGIAISKNSSSKKLMIFLEGGGACFDLQTCLTNPANVGRQSAEKTAGVFDRANMQNPVRDWNYVYVPYCTGDTHGGDNEAANVPGVGPQKFVGYANMKKFLDRVVPTFKDATDVLLTGISAGGFGAAQNAVLVQRAFQNVKVKAIDDSGPPLSKVAIAECLQDLWRTSWGLDKTFLADCGAACPNKKDYAQDYGLFLAKTFSDRSSGLIEATEDGIISGFFGIGSNNCTGILLATPVPGATFKAELLAFREKVRPYSSFSTYFPTGTQHTWISGPSFYTGSAGGVKLVDWFRRIVNDEIPGHVGP